ncbi:restriction endonuclease subunit S [Neolewinella sp.]|uniref:restriction endonuclease subunit S n=1 Tax=Neolewinella sp. TaxID=2993543 RepID=UPI003B52A9B6
MNLSKLDKSKWTPHGFDEIATMVSERVDPNETDLNIYVGLEHIDPENLHITRHGSSDDVNGTKLRFYPGDVIFGRRRAYQRKAAIAKSHGFCSAHAMVLRAKPAVIDPDLFPFFLHSDQFMHRAVDISVGSLSPTINWKSLRKQTFLLPPKAEQARLAELLWAGDAVVEGLMSILTQAKLVSESFQSDFFGNIEGSKTRFSRIADIRYGLTVNAARRNSIDKEPYLRVGNVYRGALDLSEVKEIGIVDGDQEKYALEENDILIVEGHANIQEIGRAAVWQNEWPYMLHQNHVIRARCIQKGVAEVIASYLNSQRGRSYFQQNAKSTSGLNTINSTIVKLFKIPNFSDTHVNSFRANMAEIDTTIVSTKKSLASARALQKSIINRIF